MVAMAPLVELADVAVDGRVRFTDVQRAGGISRGALRAIVDDGLVVPTPVRIRHAGDRYGRPAQTFTLDDAVFVVACAALAFAAGVALVTIVKAARATGATVDPAAGRLIFPLGPLP